MQAQTFPLVDILEVVPQSYIPSLFRASWTLDEDSEPNLVRVTPVCSRRTRLSLTESFSGLMVVV
jgi:hypothetical protein